MGIALNETEAVIWGWLKFYNISIIKIKKCKFCKVLLNENNTYSSDWVNKCRMCKNCRSKEYKKNITSEKQNVYGRNSNLRLKENVINAYGGKCECCGRSEWQFLTIDHIGRTGAKHREDINKKGSGNSINQWLKNENYPKEGFRLLCMNCNACDGFHGFCPHSIKKSVNCVDCNILLNSDNQFSFYVANVVSLCKICVVNRGIKRKTAKDIVINNKTLEQRRILAKKDTLNCRKILIEGYGGKCECCGENNYMFLAIDHINNNGAQERKNVSPSLFVNTLIKNNFPKNNYRLLCYNCNCSRGFYGQCYHELCRKLNVNDISISEYKDIILNNKV